MSATSTQDRSVREQMNETQRLRILMAMIALASECGAQSVTVAQVLGRSGVSRKTFYEHFRGRGDCLLAALEQTLTLAGSRALAGYEAHEGWLDRVRAGLAALLEFFDQEPQLARLCVLCSLEAGPEALALRAEILERLARVIDQGRADARRQPPPLSAEGVVAAMLGMVQSRLLGPGSGPLIELLNPLMSITALLYRDDRTARGELSRSSPEPCRGGDRRPARDSLSGLGLRLTYRTLTVLRVIAAQPGLSNSEVAQRAGISDQSQISKLLSRLCQAGLLENTGRGQAFGRPNAWRLSHRGGQVQRAVWHEPLLASNGADGAWRARMSTLLATPSLDAGV